mmetsp:Transcript_45536/g.102836  ORF Transcript_45536/g.102836 Transcript_45536/m.102836 type:complete len:250 (-) Transcript_45536:606-1355(-)
MSALGAPHSGQPSKLAPKNFSSRPLATKRTYPHLQSTIKGPLPVLTGAPPSSACPSVEAMSAAMTSPLSSSSTSPISSSILASVRSWSKIAMAFSSVTPRSRASALMRSRASSIVSRSSGKFSATCRRAASMSMFWDALKSLAATSGSDPYVLAVMSSLSGWSNSTAAVSFNTLSASKSTFPTATGFLAPNSSPSFKSKPAALVSSRLWSEMKSASDLTASPLTACFEKKRFMNSSTISSRFDLATSLT